MLYVFLSGSWLTKPRLISVFKIRSVDDFGASMFRAISVSVGLAFSARYVSTFHDLTTLSTFSAVCSCTTPSACLRGRRTEGGRFFSRLKPTEFVVSLLTHIVLVMSS